MEDNNLEKAEVLDRLFMSIAEARGGGQKLMEEFAKKVRDSGVPSIKADTAKLNVGVGNAVKGFLKGGNTQWSQEFIEIENEKLPGYVIYAMPRDYGKLLMVSWFLVADRRKLPLLARNFAKMHGMNLLELSIYENEELSAFASVAHQAIKEAVEEMMKSKQLDFSKIDTHTRGFLNLA